MMNFFRKTVFLSMLAATWFSAYGSEKYCIFSFDQENETAALKGTGFNYSDEGKISGTIELQGVKSNVLLETDEMKKLFDGKDESFTVEMWVKPLESPNERQYILLPGKNSGTNIWKIDIDKKGRIGFFARGGNKDDKISILSPSDCYGKWSHVAFVNDREEGMLRFYFNNKLVKEFKFSGNLKVELPLIIGSEKEGECFNGFIDELVITKGVKHEFNLEGRAGEENTNTVYAPAPAVTETPDPEILASWNEIDKYGINIIPCPKKIKITGKVLLDDKWAFAVKSGNLDAGIDEINKNISKSGGKPLPLNDKAGNLIAVGNFDDMKEFLKEIRSPEKPKRQGYIIDFYEKNGRTVCVIAGADRTGTLYGCVTLSNLIRSAGTPELFKCSVMDWPDYGGRMAFSIRSLDLKTCKESIDQAFQAKINIMWGRTIADTLEDMIKTAPQRKIIYDYAKARGIKIVIGSYFNVGEAPVPKDLKASKSYYPYKPEEGLIGSIGRAFTWSRDDLLTKRGKLFAQLMRESGADTFYLHCMDTGGRFNPENWNNRTHMDIKRWGNDRSAADYNMISKIYAEMKKENPDMQFYAVIYPYSASYLQYQDIKTWLEKLSKMLPEEILFCQREDLRDNMKIWRDATGNHGSFNYHKPYCYDFLFSAVGRCARTFLFNDNDVYWFCSGCPAGILVAAEYSWNTEAPGWGWLPKGFSSIPQIESCPPEISGRLLPRISADFYGKEVASEVTEILLMNLSQQLTVNMEGFYGVRPEVFFESKYQAALKSEVLIASAEKKLNRDFSRNFSALKTFISSARCLTEARHRYYNSRKMLSMNKYDDAREEIEKAKKALDTLGSENVYAKTLFKDLDIAADIKWHKELNEYIKQHPVKNNISVGIYIPHNRKSFYKGIMDAVTSMPGVKAVTFDDIAKDIIKKYNVIIFPAADDVGDTTEDWRENIRRFVENGGGVIFSHNSVGRFPGSAFASPLFPEICAGFEKQHADKTLIASAEHKALGEINKNYKFKHEYNDHMDIKAGPSGKILLTDIDDKTVMIAGIAGKGTVIYTGQLFGLNSKNEERAPEGDEWKLLFNMIKWSSGKN